MKKIAVLLALLLSFSVCGTAVLAQDASVSVKATSTSEKKIPTKSGSKELPASNGGSANTETNSKTESAPKADTEKGQTAAPDEIPGNTKAVTGVSFKADVEKKIIEKINKERKSLGLGELTVSEDLRSAARIRSRELCKADVFAHTRPNGDKWETVLKTDVPFKYYSAGENLCMTEYNDPSNHTATSASFWFTEWKNSPAHYKNMIRAEFNQVGVGVYVVVRNGVTSAYATTLFADVK